MIKKMAEKAVLPYINIVRFCASLLDFLRKINVIEFRSFFSINFELFFSFTISNSQITSVPRSCLM